MPEDIVTRYRPRTFYAYEDVPTGKRTAVEHFASQHTVTLANTSHALPAMDPNMRRRLLIDYVSELGVNETPQHQQE